ncbi:MAG TPA: PAS domain-containing sensor histidine kinase [Nocardioides sp.]|uniref:sensor histidine kinase n=1 Tax=uncultured Nocardioides sp. TaxID=198441 RepID=UPI00262C8823|nr:PAS domain-containing sensor histidine kinase [uncultured Nocardioides sp.]HRD60405.1 PAS domain-containing sensor histidine kinase [Nocardioides sp.]HRI96522.1 PAS domain-containing sensor histidine kinase [Nocardioides sp.]HRK45214.1 PAS domain-containing sensor histidine kinase [Nocardioides sp.]
MDWLTTLTSERAGRLLDAAPDPTVVVDGSGALRYANERVAEVFGHPREELIGRDVRTLVPDWNLAELQRPAAQQLVPTTVARHRNGHTLPVEVTVVPLGGPGDPDGQVTVFLRDISARVRLEQEADRMRDELIANISHELRTPLTSIVGYLELLHELDETQLGQQARRLLEVVARNAHRELRLVNDLLAVSFVDEDHARMHLEPVDLGVVAAQVVEDHQLFARGAGLEVTYEAEESVIVRGDADRLVRLLENLVVNSCKFSPPGGAVRVLVTAEGPDAVLTVIDTGIGVSEAERTKIFDRMYRAPGAIVRQVDGAGLGLSIAKGIVDAHSGTIVVDSTPGQGTTVRVTLPRSAPRSAQRLGG